MSDLLDALRDPDVPFLRYAFMIGILGSIAFGVVGTYVTTRRITYIAGAISHCVLGGIGITRYLRVTHHWDGLNDLYGAMAAALLAAVIIGEVSLHAREREDTVIGTVWALGMAIGVLFLFKTPGYAVAPMSYLFGDILYVSRSDVWLVALLDIVVLGISIFFYPRMLAVCFDEEFASLRGVRVGIYYLLLLGLVALTVVLMVRLVGVVMVIALLTLPAAVAGQLSFARRMWHIMVIAAIACALFTSGGLAVSYVYDWPSGPTIILLGGITYLLTVTVRAVRKRFFPARPRSWGLD